MYWLPPGSRSRPVPKPCHRTGGSFQSPAFRVIRTHKSAIFNESTGLDSNSCNPSDPERACVSATLNFGRIEILLQGALHDWEAEPFSEFCSFFGEQAYLLKSERCVEVNRDGILSADAGDHGVTRSGLELRD